MHDYGHSYGRPADMGGPPPMVVDMPDHFDIPAASGDLFHSGWGGDGGGRNAGMGGGRPPVMGHGGGDGGRGGSVGPQAIKQYSHPHRPPQDRRRGGGDAKPHNPRSREDRAWRYFEKILIDDSLFPPHVRPAAVIIGVRGSNHAKMQEKSACCVQLRGRGISSPGTPGADDPMHLWVKYDEEQQLETVKSVLDEIIRGCDQGPPLEVRRSSPPHEVYAPPRGAGPPAGSRPHESLPSGPAPAPEEAQVYGGPPPPGGSTPGPADSVEFLYTLHIICHEAAEMATANQSGLWVDKLPRAYEDFFRFPFEIDRFFPPNNLKHQAPFRYLIELLSSLSRIVTVQSCAGPLEADGRFYVKAAVPLDVSWSEFQAIAEEQIYMLSCDGSKAPESPPTGQERPQDASWPNEAFPTGGQLYQPPRAVAAGGYAPPSTGQPDAPAAATTGPTAIGGPLDLDEILPAIDTPGQQEAAPAALHTLSDDDAIGNAAPDAAGGGVMGRRDVPDTPILLVIQALHRLISTTGPLRLDQLENEFKKMWDVPLDVTMCGDSSAFEFVSGFRDVINIVSSDPNDTQNGIMLTAVPTPNFRGVAERLARVMHDERLSEALRSTKHKNRHDGADMPDAQSRKTADGQPLRAVAAQTADAGESASGEPYVLRLIDQIVEQVEGLVAHFRSSNSGPAPSSESSRQFGGRDPREYNRPQRVGPFRAESDALPDRVEDSSRGARYGRFPGQTGRGAHSFRPVRNFHSRPYFDGCNQGEDSEDFNPDRGSGRSADGGVLRRKLGQSSEEWPGNSSSRTRGGWPSRERRRGRTGWSTSRSRSIDAFRARPPMSPDIPPDEFTGVSSSYVLPTNPRGSAPVPGGSGFSDDPFIRPSHHHIDHSRHDNRGGAIPPFENTTTPSLPPNPSNATNVAWWRNQHPAPVAGRSRPPEYESHPPKSSSHMLDGEQTQSRAQDKGVAEEGAVVTSDVSPDDMVSHLLQLLQSQNKPHIS